jgi:hypothetical protein
MRSIGYARLPLRGASDRILHLCALAAIVMTIATAIILALRIGTHAHPLQVSAAPLATSCPDETWPYLRLGCNDESANNRRRIRLISTDRISQTTVTAANVPVEHWTTNDTDPTAIGRTDASQIETGLRPRGAAKKVAASSPPSTRNGYVRRASRRSQEVPSTARADARRPAHHAASAGKPSRNGGFQISPAPAVAPKAYSFTGIGRSFDAVH